MPMTSGQLEASRLRNVRLVPDTPTVKQAETRELLNNDATDFSRSAKSADPTCYNSLTVELTGLFDMERQMKPLWKKGDVVTIYQLSYSKGLTVEGKATVVKPLDPEGGNEHYMVRFHRKDGKLDREAYERFIDREGQAGDEQDYIKAFNAKCGIVAA